jgi:hypothetical protein
MPSKAAAMTAGEPVMPVSISGTAWKEVARNKELLLAMLMIALNGPPAPLASGRKLVMSSMLRWIPVVRPT